MPDHQQQTTTSTSTSTTTASSGGTDAEQQLVGNQAIVDLIKAHNNSTGPRELNPNKNGIVFLGFNEYAHDEANHLNRINRSDGGAIAARPGTEQDKITRNGTSYDLQTTQGVAKYTATLGLPDQQAVQAAEFLLGLGDKARDEMAQFIRILSEAEMGERDIDRMVLSGHSVGSQIWGDHNGSVSFKALNELFDIFPNAAGQVEHLMLSACYAGGESKMSQYHEMFGNAQSVMAYHGSSPGTWSGAMDHMTRWESATDAGKDPGGVDPGITSGLRKSENVSTWNSVDGYQGDKPMSVRDIQNALSSQEGVYYQFFNGVQEVENSQAGPLRTYYNLVQRALAHPDLSSSIVADLEVKRDVTIRLLYFGLIGGKFQNHYKDQLDSGIRAAGLTVPDFATLGRKGTLDFINDLEAAGGDNSTTAAVDLLKRGLKDLNTDVIPTAWV
jgi:hypothetical protein